MMNYFGMVLGMENIPLVRDTLNYVWIYIRDKLFGGGRRSGKTLSGEREAFGLVDFGK
jgi:hypothetical protein